MATRNHPSKFLRSTPKATTPFSTANKLVVIDGPIGVGKTSLTRMLSDRWQCKNFYEVFEENPFLTGGFYENADALAFNTEVFFLLSRFRQQKELLNLSGLVVSDYLFEKNWIFARQNLAGQELDIYQTTYERFLPQVRQPDLIVYMQADLETLLRRIYFRDRRFERSLSPAYLEKLMGEYYRFFSTYTQAPVITVQTSGLDFVNDPEDFRKIANSIEERLSGKIQLALKTKGRARQKDASA